MPGWGGYHWYTVPRVGYPDPETFRRAYVSLAAFHDEVWERTGIAPERTVLGGFSMGSVMSYALGLAGERPTPAGILAFSGFIPRSEGCSRISASRSVCRSSSPTAAGTRSWMSSSRGAPMSCSKPAGLPVSYHESDAGHHIDPSHIPSAMQWLAAATGDSRPAAMTSSPKGR